MFYQSLILLIALDARIDGLIVLRTLFQFNKCFKNQLIVCKYFKLIKIGTKILKIDNRIEHFSWNPKIKMKLRHILLINSILSAIVIANAFLLRKQFYPSVNYMTKSKISITVIIFIVTIFAVILFIHRYINILNILLDFVQIIGFEAILLLWLYARLLVKILFNQLTASESEVK